MGGDHERRAVRKWSSQFDRGRAGAHRTCAATRRDDLRQRFQDRPDVDEDDSCAGVYGPPAGHEWLVFDQHFGKSRRRSFGRPRIVQDEGRVEARRARIYSPAEALPGSLRQDSSQGADQLLSATRGQQGRLGQYRHLRVAGLSDADQGGFPVPRLDPGSANRTGFGFVFGPGQARRNARDSGMAELLLQVADVRAGALSRARPVHPVDAVEEYAAMDDGRGFNYASRAGVLRLRVFWDRTRASWRSGNTFRAAMRCRN